MRSLSLSIRFNVLKDIMGYIFSQEQKKKRRNNGNTFLIENEHEFKFLAFVACILRTAACE